MNKNHNYLKGNYLSTNAQINARNKANSARKVTASNNDKKEPENLGTLIFLVNSKKEIGVKMVDFIAIPKNNNKTNARNRALLALYIARKNYEIITASVDELLNKTNKYRNNASRESVIDALRDDNQILTPAQNSLPTSKSSCEIAILNILRENFYNVFKHIESLSPSEFAEAKILLQHLAKLSTQIKSKEISLDNLTKIKSACSTTYNQ